MESKSTLQPIKILKGDAFPLRINILANNVPVDPKEIAELSVTVGNVTKNWPGQIEFYEGAFYFPITQQDSFSFDEGAINVTVRPMFTSDNVIGTVLMQAIIVQDSDNREILDGKEN